ncbi:MAG: STAS domain-containing protein [Anaerolineae bacterium]|nr:STAS domain-containing protein [Anaerolineae bacterium]RIK24038.1 MAG: sulfate transporter [Anaerolineae bacterium]
MGGGVETAAFFKWSPRDAIAPALRYLQQPARLISGYNRENLRPDLLAGLTVGIIMLPQAIAYSLLAGLPPKMGLYTAVVGGIAAALWGSSDQLHSGPTNTTSLLLFSTLAILVAPNSTGFIVAAGLMTIMVGVFQLTLGLLRLGFVVNFVSHSVIVGFSTGAGVLIALNQIDPLLGLTVPRADVVTGLQGTIRALPEIEPLTAALGIGTMLVIVLLRRIAPRLPGPLIAIGLASLVVFLLGERAADVAVIGDLPSSVPPIARLPFLDLELIGRLSTGALAIAAIGLVQTTAVSRSLATQTRQRLDNNQEFVGQGIANIFSGMFSGYATSGSFSVSAVKFRAGARTRLASVFAGLIVLLVMLTMGPVGAYMPVSALAGTLIITAFNMINRSEIRRIFQGAPGDAIIMVVTFLGTLFLELDFAVLSGILLSFVLYLIRTSAPRVQVVVPDESFRHFTHRPEAPVCPQLGIVEIQGDLYFGAVSHIEEEILELASRHPGQRYLLIRMHQVNQIDFSGIHMLENLVRTFRDRGGDVFLVRVARRARRLMETTGCLAYLGERNILDEDDAVDYLFHHVLDPAVCIYECPVRVFRECQNLPKRFDLIDILPPGIGIGSAEVANGAVAVPAQAPRDVWLMLRTLPPMEKPVILDVREPREYRRSHIVDAQSLPLSVLLQQGAVLQDDKPVILVCRTGRRSRRAAAVLRSLGYSDVSLVDGGMLAWEAAGLLTAVEFDATESSGLSQAE